MIRYSNDLVFESEIPDYIANQSQPKITFFQNPGSSTKSDLGIESAISDSGTKSFSFTNLLPKVYQDVGGEQLIRNLNDLMLESIILDYIAKSESAESDLFSKPRQQHKK